MELTEDYKEARPLIIVAIGFVICLIHRKELSSDPSVFGNKLAPKEKAMEHARDWVKILEAEK
jgi:hypothetical protein